MKVKRFFYWKIRASLILSILAAILIGTPIQVFARTNPPATFSKLDLVANIETIGVLVTGANLPQTAGLAYRQSGEATWHTGHPLLRMDAVRLTGSLFGLSPSTSYEIKVTDGVTEIFGTVTTQADEIQFTPAAILHVDDNAAPGGDGSASAPFRTIQDAVNRATPGTQVLVADGIYHETVVLPNSGTAGNWIQVKAEGSGAILDGAKQISGNIWTTYARNVWMLKLDVPIGYLARDLQRYYMYDNLTGLMAGVGHNNVPMPEGWYVVPNTKTLYVRSLDNPSKHTWQIPQLNGGFEANAHDWLWVEGFEIRFYGAYYGCGICMRDTSHIVIRKNKIHNLQKGIFIEWTGGESRGNDTRIEYNEIYDPPVNEWQWKAVKSTSMEGTAIIIRGHSGAIVRGNDIHNFFNGIYTGSSGDAENSALAFDADIYNNHIYQISDDALEPEGACVNQRFRNNTVDSAYVGISLAPVTQGPVWVLRSTFANYTGRGIKLDGNPDGIVLVYHNTFWTPQKYPSGIDFISAASNITMRNNIFQTYGYGFYESRTGSRGNNWNYDNWYTSYSPRFKWENINYINIPRLCAGTGFECNGHENAPELTNPGGGDFTLLPSSPNIDHGVVIPGINDNYSGKAPDIGAYEFASAPPPPAVDQPPVVSSIARADADPTNAASVNFTVTFSESVSGVDANDFVLTANIKDASITSVTPVSGTTYTVNVNTGSGDGALRVDVVDNDSILDAAGNPLGGVGAGNGNFSTGDTYTVQRSLPAATTVTFNSIGTQDGWVLEAGEFANKGGALDRVATVINIGDDNSDRQYKGILSFITDSLPDDAVITAAQLNIKKQGVTGSSPFSTHGNLLAEINNGAFSNNIELVTDDFSAAASPASVQEKFSALDSAWFTVNLNPANLTLINKGGATQFRLFFSKDDDDDLSADYVKIFSGNAAASDQPQLVVTYSLPMATVTAPMLAPVNQSPVITSNGSVSLAENTTAASVITATDSEVLTYSISGGIDAALFNLNAATGELMFVAPPNYEAPADSGADNVYNVTVQASDGALVTTRDMTITVTPINDVAPIITSQPNFSIAENTAIVASITAADGDLPAQPLTYSISGGTDAALFNLNSASGELTFITAPNYEIPADAGLDNIYNLTVQASDGEKTVTQDVTVTVTPINDNTPFITSTTSLNLPENTATVSVIAATDADLPVQTLTYSIIGGADAGLFNINAATGELNFVTAPDYEIPADAGLDNIYNLTVQASDGEKTVAQEMSITVAPTNDNTPVITSTKNISVAEKTTTVATITAMDADLPAQALSYVITGGADASDFSIDKNTGTLTFITAPDYELPADSGMDNICNVVVQASDGELTVAQDIIVTITAVNDNMPVITSASNISIEENKTAVTTITAKDADLPSETLTYSISGGADASKFSINKDSGTLTFIAAPDFESPADADKNNTYEVTIKVSDGVFHISRNITITILDSIELLSPAQ